MPKPRILSADSHVVEPADLWTQRVDRRYRTRAPHVVKEVAGIESDWFVFEGLRPFPVAGLGVAGVDPRDYPTEMLGGYSRVRPGAWDPVARIDDQEVDGVAGEFIYPSIGMLLYALADGELRAACFRAYNDWIAEFCRHDPARLAGAALIPQDELQEAISEVKRAADLGLRGGMIWGSPPRHQPYDDPRWDPLWAAAQDANLPLSLHILTGHGGSGVEEGSLMKNYPSLPHAMERSLSDLIFGGVFERFPRLRVVSAENDVGWIPHYLQRLDHSYEKYRYLEQSTAIPEKPSVYFRRQVYATFQDDRIGVLLRDQIGLDRLMWASDFPHSDSTWPHSREVIERDFEGVPEPEAAQILADNCAALYALGGAATRSPEST